MKIIFVNSAWPQSWGGGEKWTIDAADWFRRRGDDVTVVARPGSLVYARAKEHELAAVEFKFGGDFDLRHWIRARSFLKVKSPNIIVVNFNKEAWTFGPAARSLGIPLVARHGFPLFRKAPHHRLLYHQFMKCVVINSETILDRYQHLGLDSSRIEIILNGVMSPESRHGELRKMLGLNAAHKLVVSAGRLESQKRFDRLIEIARQLIPADDELHFALFGQGPLEAELRAAVATGGIEGRFHFVGFREDFASLVCDGDLFALTSDEEGTPNALLETMVAGVPCVSFDVGAVPRIFLGDLSKFMFPRGDTTAMCSKIADILRSSSRAEIGRQMREVALRDFGFDASMRRYAELLERIVRSA